MENKRTETNKTVQKRLEPELKLINMDTVEVEQIESQEGTFPDACIVTCLTTALKGDKM